MVFSNALVVPKDALHHWQDAPVVILENWDDLFPTVVELMGDPDKLDKMQAELRTWYDGWMRKVVSEFEDFMLAYDGGADVEQAVA